jgi:hypothetical protein
VKEKQDLEGIHGNDNDNDGIAMIQQDCHNHMCNVWSRLLYCSPIDIFEQSIGIRLHAVGLVLENFQHGPPVYHSSVPCLMMLIFGKTNYLILKIEHSLCFVWGCHGGEW